jgi:hypothetical protein
MCIQLKGGMPQCPIASSSVFYKKTMTTLTIFQVVHNPSPKMDSVQEENHRTDRTPQRSPI